MDVKKKELEDNAELGRITKFLLHHSDSSACIFCAHGGGYTASSSTTTDKISYEIKMELSRLPRQSPVSFVFAFLSICLVGLFVNYLSLSVGGG